MHPARNLLGGPPTGPARPQRRQFGGKLRSRDQPLVAVPNLGEEHSDLLADRAGGLGSQDSIARARHSWRPACTCCGCSAGDGLMPTFTATPPGNDAAVSGQRVVGGPGAWPVIVGSWAMTMTA
jgi:hypothetical protein